MEGVLNDEYRQGIIPRTIYAIFEGINKKVNTLAAPVDFTVKISYIEIYKDEIRDLFVPLKSEKNSDFLLINPMNLKIREDKIRGFFVEGLTERIVLDAEECMKYFRAGTN